MGRRDFIVGLLTVELAQAQQKAQVCRIAVVHPSEPVGVMSETGSFTGPAYSLELYRAFFLRLRQLGRIEGQNFSVARYSGQGRTEHFAELAREVVRGNPDLIFVNSSLLTREIKAATDTIPVVSIVSDPVASGIVSNLARPGGNITGSTVDTGVEIIGPNGIAGGMARFAGAAGIAIRRGTARGGPEDEDFHGRSAARPSVRRGGVSSGV
jgi:putative ABC transport system substrate-binding protein